MALKFNFNFKIIWVNFHAVSDSVWVFTIIYCCNSWYILVFSVLKQYSYVGAHNTSVELTKASKIYKSHSFHVTNISSSFSIFDKEIYLFDIVLSFTSGYPCINLNYRKGKPVFL